MRLALATLAALAVCGAVLWVGTDGLRAFTTEQARRLAIAEHPVLVPAAIFEDQDGRAFQLDDYRGTPVLVEFVYVRCRALCASMGAGFQRLQSEFERDDGEVRLLSSPFQKFAHVFLKLRVSGAGSASSVSACVRLAR